MLMRFQSSQMRRRISREMSVFRKMAEIAEKNRSSCAMDALLRFGNSINGRELICTVQQLVRNALAPSTRLTYKTGFRSSLRFCSEHSPLEEE